MLFARSGFSDQLFQNVQQLLAESAAEHGGAEKGTPLIFEQFPGQHARRGIGQGVGKAPGQKPASGPLEEQGKGAFKFLPARRPE